MKSVVYWSVALPALMLGAPATASNDSPEYLPYGAEYEPTAPYDDAAYDWNDRVYSEQDSQSGVYDGTWTGNYIDDRGQVYQGEWEGTYIDENGQAYAGSYRGTSVGDPRYDDELGTSGVPTSPYRGDGYDPVGYGDPYYDAPYDDDVRYERRDDGVGGAIIGGVAGGVAGNVIAGRGNRLAGTLIGGGIGAVAGAAIDQAEDRGRYAQPQYYGDRQGYARRGAPHDQRRYRQGHGNGGPTGYGWQGHRTYYRGAAPAYYYPQAYTGGTTTVIVVPGQTTSTTTTTVTEETYVTGGKRHRSKRLMRK